MSEEPENDEEVESAEEDKNPKTRIPWKTWCVLSSIVLVGGFSLALNDGSRDASTGREKNVAKSSPSAWGPQKQSPGGFSAGSESAPPVGEKRAARHYRKKQRKLAKRDARIRRKRIFTQADADRLVESGNLRAEASDILVDVQQPWRRLVRTSRNTWRMKVDKSHKDKRSKTGR